MVLRKHISYTWRIFIPLTVSLWVAIIAMVAWQVYQQRQMREDAMRQQLALINSRIVNAFKSDLNPKPFMEFIARYYREDERYEDVRISAYINDELYYNVGEQVKLDSGEVKKSSGITLTPGVETLEELKANNASISNFFYQADSAYNERGQKLKVYTVQPFNEDISTAANALNNTFLLSMLIFAVVMTAVSLIASRHFGRNIHFLRDFAHNAANDPNFIPDENYSKDELGDISRQIVNIYKAHTQAAAKVRREHTVAMNAIEEKARVKRQLTNNINHELKTPIGVIKGYIDTIVENPDMDADSRNHFLRKAQEHVTRLVSLIADVAAITRLEEGESSISTEPLDYHDLVFAVSSDLNESGALGSMEFVYDIPFNCEIMGNYNLLTGMLINLAKNAAAYSKGTQCMLKLESEDENSYTFVFYDDGKGVEEQHLPHLFDRFYRVDSGRTRKAGGTGLGLPIVQSTVIAHGGTIIVENRPGAGLQFRYSLRKAK